MFRKNYLKELEINLPGKGEPSYSFEWFANGFSILARMYNELPQTSVVSQKRMIQFIVLSEEIFKELNRELSKLVPSPYNKRLLIDPTIKAAQKIQSLHKGKSGIIKNIDFEAIAKNEIIKYQSEVDRNNAIIDNPPDEMDIQGLDRLYSMANERQELAYEANALGDNCFDKLNNLANRVLELLGSNESSAQGTVINKNSYLRPEFENRLTEIESKISNKVEQWKSGNDKIGCAAFAEVLYNRKYLIQGKDNRQRRIHFAKNRYGINIKIQTASSKDLDREKHKRYFKKHFQ